MTAIWINAAGSLGTLVAAIAALYGVIRTHRVASETRTVAAETKELVNGNSTEQVQRGDQLVAALTAAGVDVPARPPTEGA